MVKIEGEEKSSADGQILSSEECCNVVSTDVYTASNVYGYTAKGKSNLWHGYAGHERSAV